MSKFTDGMEPFYDIAVDVMGDSVHIGNSVISGIYTPLDIAETRMIGGRARNVSATLVIKRTDFDIYLANGPRKVVINGEKMRLESMSDDDTNCVTLTLSPNTKGAMPSV